MEDFSEIIKKEMPDLNIPIRQNDPHLPKHPFFMVINGRTGCGKSNLVFNLLLHPDYMLNYTKLYIFAKDLEEDKYQWLEGKMKEVAKRMKVDLEEIFEKGNKQADLPNTDSFDKKKMNLVIFDDFVVDKDQSKIAEYFIRIRKKNSSIIFISHRWHAIDKTIRAQLSHVVLFKQDAKEITKICQDFCTDITKDEFKALLNSATMKPYEFLYIDNLCPHKELKYRKNLLGLSCWNNEQLLPSHPLPNKIKLKGCLDYLDK